MAQTQNRSFSIRSWVQCSASGRTRAPGGSKNGANKANRQPKVRPYATMVFGSISADVRAKTNPIPWSSSGITTARKIITNGQPRNDPTLRAGLPTLRAWARPREGHGHGKGKLIRTLFSVDFGGFRG